MAPALALTAEQEAKLLASDGQGYAFFGADVGLEGDTAIIGAYGDQQSGRPGQVHIFDRLGGAWLETFRLTPSDGEAGDSFGYGVALDGDTALVGSCGDDDNGDDSGSAYVFTRAGGVWTEQAKLLPADGASEDGFGCRVALDGNTALIGAASDDDQGLGSGSAYVFVRSGEVWSEQAKLLPADGVEYEFFGSSVALDGDTAVVGAPQYVDSEYPGSVYVFIRSGEFWTESVKLSHPESDTDALFGSAVAVDGDTLLVGVPTDEGTNGTNSGSSYVFVRSGQTWTQQAKLVASDGGSFDNFGKAVALDGDAAVVTAVWDQKGQPPPGRTYLFTRADGAWTEQVKVEAVDGEPGYSFGWSAAIDGERFVAGAPWEWDSGQWSGSAFVFRMFEEDEVPAAGRAGALLTILILFGLGLVFLRRGIS